MRNIKYSKYKRFPQHSKHLQCLYKRIALTAVVIIGIVLAGIAYTHREHHSEPTVTIPAAHPTMELAPKTHAPDKATPVAAAQPTYPSHTNITASMFYVGEPANVDNGYIANRASTWDEQWATHYGGVDSPSRRNGWLPAGFTPKANPFYIALPYSDLNDEGNRKQSASNIYWYNKADTPGHSLVKNHWVEVCKSGICAYGQWEDAGPFGEDDVAYVFGSAQPANTDGLMAGIDLSPAMDDYLHLSGSGLVNWRFVEQPPAGPWLLIH